MPFYGFPQGEHEPDWSKLDREGPRPHGGARQLLLAGGRPRARSQAARMGKDVTLTVYPGSGHAFMAPHNALGTKDEALAAKIWPEVISFLKKNVQVRVRSAQCEVPLSRAAHVVRDLQSPRSEVCEACGRRGEAGNLFEPVEPRLESLSL